jgi:hypothetical protein
MTSNAYIQNYSFQTFFDEIERDIFLAEGIIASRNSAMMVPCCTQVNQQLLRGE